MFRHYGRLIDDDNERAQLQAAETTCERREVRRLRAGGLSRACMQRLADTLFAEHALVLRDVEYDGSCVVWSVMPALARRLGRATTVFEARRLLVYAMQRDALADEVARDFRATNAIRCREGRRPYTSVAELFDEWKQPGVYLPPILAAKATEWFTGERVRVWTLCGDALIELYTSDGDGEYTVELAYHESLQHMARVVPYDADAIERRKRASYE